MKISFYAYLVGMLLMCTNPISAQTTINFSFKIWKNSMNSANYLGTYTGTATTAQNGSYYVTTNPMTQSLCPGDQLIIQQNCAISSNNSAFSQHNFHDNNIDNYAMIGLSNTNQSQASVTPLASIGPFSQTVPDLGTWLWNATATVTLLTTPSNNGYLTIGNGLFPDGNVPPVGCATLVAFIPLNFAPAPPTIDDLTLCPSEIVNVPTTNGYSYSGWNANDPNGMMASDAVGNYSVEVTHTLSNCTVNDEFSISTTNPDAEMKLPTHLCYGDRHVITVDDVADLNGGGPSSVALITVNGDPIYDELGGAALPYEISMATHGTGTVTVEYYYNLGGGSQVTCSKIYEIVILPEIEINLQSSYGWCGNNFQQICATTSGIAQNGIDYQWAYGPQVTVGSPTNVVGTGVCFTPTAYGTYYLIASDKNGCVKVHEFRVYNSGVGIQHPKNIVFCSLTERSPRYIGWATDPLGAIPYSFTWTYTDLSGQSTTIVNTGPQYQVPYQGLGTYTVVVNIGNGCTETFTMTVTDLLQVYNNHSNAAFMINPLLNNEVACLPTVAMTGMTETWIVTDEFGNTIPTTTHLNGIKFNYSIGVEYEIELKRIAYRQCQIFTNKYTWEDKFKNTKRRRAVVSESNVAAEVLKAFPNPTRGKVTVQLSEEAVNGKLIVTNTLGQVVLEKIIDKQTVIELDLSKYEAGMYWMNLSIGEQQIVQKLLKQ